MKAFRQTLVILFFIGITAIGVQGIYNSNQMSHVALLKNDHGIKFTKRLDELNGEYVKGRYAASIPSASWENIKPKAEVKKVAAKKAVVKKEEPKKIVKFEPAPVIEELPDVQLTAALVNKKTLEVGKDVEGSIVVADGFIKSLNISLPNGDPIEIETHERMSGNVFMYYDHESGEEKSGLLYEVEKGKRYMVTLANHSLYPGARFEFGVKEGTAELAYDQEYYDAQESWNMNAQNEEDNIAGNDEVETDEELDYDSEEEQAQSFEFNFKNV